MFVLEIALGLALIVVLLGANLFELGRVRQVADLILEALENGENDAPN